MLAEQTYSCSIHGNTGLKENVITEKKPEPKPVCFISLYYVIKQNEIFPLIKII